MCMERFIYPENERWKQYNQELLKGRPVALDAPRRRSVEAAVRETCEKRNWHLYAANVRTNHVHSVIAIGVYDPDKALGALKANATRQMREDGFWASEDTPWAEKGSCRRLWNERSIWEASDYVLNRQGEDLSKYDWW